MYFQRFSAWVLPFRAYDTCCLHFLPNIKLGQLQVTVLKRSRDFGKTINYCKICFHFYRLNILSKLLWIVRWFKVYDTRYRHFFRISKWSNCRSQFWSNDKTLVKLSYFQKNILLLSSKCILKAPLNVLYVLPTLIHDTCFLIEYQTGAIADHRFAKVTWP